jgi:hypothetical protein
MPQGVPLTGPKALPKGDRRGFEAAKGPGQRRDTILTTVVFRPPSKSRLDEHSNANGSLPTGSTATTMLVAVSITDTVLSASFVT